MTVVALQASQVQLLSQQLQQVICQEEQENRIERVELFKRADKMTQCDGLKDEALRKWVRNVDKAYKSISGISESEREQWMITFIGVTIKGWLSGFLLEKLGTVEERRTWEYLRKVVVEECMEDADMLRFNIGRLVQSQTESVYSYNQRYAEDLPWAYESADLEHPLVQEFLVTDYVRGLKEQDIAYQTLHEHPKTVSDAMFAAEHAEYIAREVKHGCKYRTKKNAPKPYNIVSYRQMP